MNIRIHVAVVGILGLITLSPMPVFAQTESRVDALETRVREDRVYRNRFIVASGFTIALLLLGLYVISRPHDSAPRPR